MTSLLTSIFWVGRRDATNQAGSTAAPCFTHGAALSKLTPLGSNPLGAAPIRTGAPSEDPSVVVSRQKSDEAAKAGRAAAGAEDATSERAHRAKVAPRGVE